MIAQLCYLMAVLKLAETERNSGNDSLLLQNLLGFVRRHLAQMIPVLENHIKFCLASSSRDPAQVCVGLMLCLEVIICNDNVLTHVFHKKQQQFVPHQTLVWSAQTLDLEAKGVASKESTLLEMLERSVDGSDFFSQFSGLVQEISFSWLFATQNNILRCVVCLVMVAVF